jgi:acetyl-CoA synthetase
VAEAAVTAASDPTTGQAIIAFVILRGGVLDESADGSDLVKTLRDHVLPKSARSPSRVRS